MKIDIEALTYIINVIGVAKVCKIESISIEPDIIRGSSEENTVCIIHSENIPKFAFGAITMNRLREFQDRIGIALEEDAQFEADIFETKKEKYVKSISCKGNRINIQYRCANPLAVRAPRGLNEVPQFKINYGSDLTEMLKKANMTMKAQILTLLADGENASFEMLDSNNDIFSFDFSDDIESLEKGEEVKFAFNYPFEPLFPILQAVTKDPNAKSSFVIGKKGTLNITMNGIELYLIPRV